MFRHIVVAVDGSPNSLKALDRAINLAAQTGASLDVISVEEELPRYVSKQRQVDEEKSAAARYFGHIHATAALSAAERGIALTSKVLTGHEVQTILNYVADQGTDLLVIGATGYSGVWSAFLGSTADKLVAHAPSSVLVVRPGDGGQTYRQLLVGLDGSPNGEFALSVALALGHISGGTLRGTTVLEGSFSGAPSGSTSIPAAVTDIQARATALARAAGVNLELTVRRGHASRALTEFAEEIDADLILIGATGTERPTSHTAGGTARRIANEARCSVLLARLSSSEHIDSNEWTQSH